MRIKRCKICGVRLRKGICPNFPHEGFKRFRGISFEEHKKKKEGDDG